MGIVILDGYGLNPGDLSWDGFRELGEEVIIYDSTPDNKIIENIGDAEIVITNKTELTRDILEKVKHVKYIGVLATGYNVVDIEAASEFGMKVTNIPAYGTNAVAQFVFALLLEVCNQVAHHDKRVKEGAWAESGEFCFWETPLIELHGKTMGIIGFGKIGEATSKIARAFGMKVISYTKSPNKELENENLKFVELDELYAQSDIISLHCPLFEDTKGMINKRSIETMKDGVILINTSRGGLIVENDLREALDCGKIRAAGLDVMIEEPPRNDNPLFSAKNCIITPHIAWAPKEARERLMDIAVENVRAFINGDDMNVVNRGTVH
ncbi:D-2-hydroxyacid dehydrogenase [Oceanirhabdus sp. W0125-5]|uniref:D-2-hydroxyacid dehydrogenase n=1 Tax=Oceanirhabdus sp. W0125-5 TaxID=2999116 RepID=UPI0022F2C5DF|nr:D-2-hydroxyacid dehydrogenase [Oceanirhabdus sp. W0125-5]WBW97023.1 D-2-hydroxyacid dehydrogenase [Oceanirhabdus sp. W0125-5]